ncbi:hypothetical protein V8E53_001569 [Lactarius tabidus]
MPHFDFHVSIGNLVAPSKQVEDSDELLKRAQTLFEERRAVMNPPDCDLAESLLQHCGDLRVGFEDKCLPTRIKQARLYCARVDDALRQIQNDIDARAEALCRDGGWWAHCCGLSSTFGGGECGFVEPNADRRVF